MGFSGALHLMDSASSAHPGRSFAVFIGSPEHWLHGGFVQLHGAMVHCLPPGGAQKYNLWKSCSVASL
eukprot:CAMPEP_0170288488 /NCGR_PEP_ID=MMETSP0116_2-20130129/44304_1 /TAXON_ID=400756 /ORGANISM="Durinskia baltica, Strain CSIRO CS-38" /LENGTH=67 /DNA_ID=CAMNT_0010539911 /DNA_START=28 /DNA_END=231 /DNA_ORIENTATION=-